MLKFSVHVCPCGNVWWKGGVELCDAILSNSWAALWLLIATLSDYIVNMEHYCAFRGVYIIRLISQMLSHDQPVYYTVQSSIKMTWKRKNSYALPQPTLHLSTRHTFYCYLETFHAWNPLSFDFHLEFSIKIIQRVHFITLVEGNL